MGKLKVKSTQQSVKVGEHKGEDMYIMKVDHYTTMEADEVLRLAQQISGLQPWTLRASWEAIARVITDWTMIGHIVEIPALGNIRAEIRAKAQKDAKDVSVDDVYRRKLILTPTVKIKKELNDTELLITCYDKRGAVVRGSEKEEWEDASDFYE